MKKKKITYKIISYLIILVIFFFLVRMLFENWQKVKDYDFSFNYWYLVVSYLFWVISIILWSVIWNKILRILEPAEKISYFKAFKIFLYSWFGRYLPGKFWMFLGRIYLGEKEGLTKKTLTISVVYEVILSISSGFLFSLILLSVAFWEKLSIFYFSPLAVILIGFFLIHPKIFYFVANLILRKLKKVEIPLDTFLSYRRISQIVFYYFICFSFDGLAFFFLVKSIANISFNDIIGIIGSFVLAGMLGIVAVFAPSGLGVREGSLVLFLKFYFPLSIAVLISLVARIWSTLGEIVMLVVVYFYSKFKKKTK